MKGEIMKKTQAVRSMPSMFCVTQLTDVVQTAAETALSISCDHDTSEGKSVGTLSEVPQGCCRPGPPPHKRPAFQYYMKKFAGKVDAIYEER